MSSTSKLTNNGFYRLFKTQLLLVLVMLESKWHLEAWKSKQSVQVTMEAAKLVMLAPSFCKMKLQI